MIKQGLLNEFDYEVENTRKLLKAIPDSALEYKSQPQLWSIAQLASHIAEVYNWFEDTFNVDEFDMATYKYDKGDITKAENIVAKFEENVVKARKVLENSDESTYFNNWSMGMNGQTFIGPAPRIAMVRGFLFNHLYHHRGEMVTYLRASGNKVPGLYGPTYDDMQG